ncbi:MAG: class I SAM-dependent methyltransferase [Candidatus Omnitrophica bacterium]|nr:class I SAM-dependent methyltransferase [Candidatus Omnitrophota bacterium]
MEERIIETHKRYSSRINLFQRFGYDIAKERDFIIEKAQPIEGKILEIGTGKGYFTVALAQKGFHFTTVDISEEEQNFAKMNIQYSGLQEPVNFVVADAHKLDFPDERFDISFGINLMHHLDRPLKVIDEFLRVTASGGKVVISDFNREGFSIVEKIHQSEGRHHHSGICTLNEIAAYAMGKGIQIERFDSKCQDLIIMRKRIVKK